MQQYYAAKQKATCSCGNTPKFQTKGRVLTSSCLCGEEIKVEIPRVRKYDDELEIAKRELDAAATAVLTLKFDFLFGYTKQQDELGDRRDAYLKAKRKFQDLSAKIDQLTEIPDNKVLKLMREASKEPLNCERFKLLQTLKCISNVPFSIEDMEMIEKKNVLITK